MCFLYSQVAFTSVNALIYSSACFTPHNIQSQDESSSSATLVWSDFSTASDLVLYEVFITAFGETPNFSNPDTAYIKEYTAINLLAGNSYQFYVRSICNSGTSNWSSGSTFHTHMVNQEACGVNLAIADNNCVSPEMFKLNVDQQSGTLGVDLFIREIQLTIQHSWPADLEISVVSPSGAEVILLKDVGIGTQNMGNTGNPCEDPLKLDMDACSQIEQGNAQLIGSFRPMGDMEAFYDNNSANGDWKIKICDDAQGQVGKLIFAEIVFTETICSGPEDIFLSSILNHNASVIIPAANCDSVEILVEEVITGNQYITYVDCTGDTITLQDLSPSTNYILSYTPMCDGSTFSLSCPKNFITTCDSVINYTSFDEDTTCTLSCSTTCLIDGIWKNSADAQWNVNNGPTSTILTGPNTDKNGGGNYIYIESSDTLCDNTEAILLSSCFQVIDSTSCHLNFGYHMFGNDITYLILEASTDNMLSWDSLWMLEGQQGEIWQEANISLDAYLDMNVQLRFRTTMPEDNFGDIALDEIVLMGVELKSTSELAIFLDNDEDGYGDPATAIQFCGSMLPTGFSYDGTDCDDEDSQVNPGIPESPCNLIDDNCDGEVDDNQSVSLDYQLVSQTDQNCLGQADGTIIIQATGGVGPYIYQWIDGEEGNARSELSSGQYQAIISDQTGCQILTDTFTINILQKFDYFISSINAATCDGIYDGGINISHDETNAPYSYLWSSGDTTKNITNQTAGLYLLTITDDNGCQVETDEIDLLADRTLEVITDSLHLISCFDQSDGYIQVSIANNVGPVNYLWSTNIDTNFLSQLSFGQYIVQVTDSTNCTIDKSFTFNNPTELQSNIKTNDPVICYGESNGLLELEINGGTTPYDILWSNEIMNYNNPGISAGSYSVTVTDANGCLDSMVNLIVQQADSLTIDLINIEPSICSLDNTGKISVSANGGNGQYSYLWSDNVLRDSFADMLSAGLYTVTVTDKFNCKASIEDIGIAFIDVLLNPTFEILQQPQCFGDSTGILNISITNPTDGPYTYEFNGTVINFDAPAFAYENIAADNYDIIVTDGNGCHSDTLEVVLEEPEKIMISISDSIGNNSCFGDSLGTITVDAIGGTGNFLYNWNTNDVDSQLLGLAAGQYSVTVTDELNCSDSLINIEVTQATEFEIDTFLFSDVDCGSIASGFVEIITNLGGTAPYTFTSDQLPNNDSGLFEGLSEGIYNFAVYDNLGCFGDSIVVEISAPPALDLSVVSIDPSICDSNNGAILIDAEGGFGIINYAWSDVGISGAFAQNLTSGTYNVTITDENNCKDSLIALEVSSVINEISLGIDFVDDVKCHNSANGLISSTLSGDFTTPISYYVNGILNTSQNNSEAIISSLAPGVYELVAIDVNECRDTISDIQISAPPPIVFDLSIVDSIQCYNDTNGIVSIIASGGNGGFEYLWNNEDQGDTIVNLGAGIYTCAIVDAKSCVQFTDTIKLINPDSLVLSADILNAMDDLNNGAIYLQPAGGTKPYLYFWDPSLPTSVDTLEGLSESIWLLTIEDYHGCSLDTSFTINRIVGLNDIEDFNISIYPNPTVGRITIESQDHNPQRIDLFDSKGIRQESFSSTIISKKHSLDLQHLPAGQYFLLISIDGLKVMKSFIKIN